MRIQPSLLSVGLMIALLSGSTPAAQAFVSDAPILGVYLRSDETGRPSLGFNPADQATPVSIPLLQSGGAAAGPHPPICAAGNTCTPAVPAVPAPCASVLTRQAVSCANVLLGSTRAPSNFTVAGNSVLTVWLRSDQPTLLEAVSFGLQRVHETTAATTIATYTLDTGQSAEVRSAPLALSSTPTSLTLGARFTAPVHVRAGEQIQLRLSSLSTLTPAADAPPQASLQVFVVYGAAQPTGVLLPVEHPDSVVRFALMQRGQNTMGLYLGNNTLDFQAPSAAQARARPYTGTVGNAPTEMRWGVTRPDENSTLVGNAIYTFFARVATEAVHDDKQGPGVLANLQLRVSLYVDKTIFTATSHAVPTVLASNDAAGAWFIGSIPISRTHVPTGAPIDVGVGFVGANPNGVIEILYGAATHPSGVLIPVEGGGHYFPPPEPKADVPVPVAPAPNTTGPPAAPPPPPSEEPVPATSDNSTDQGEGSDGSAAGPTTVKSVSRTASAPAAPLVLFLALMATALAWTRRK